MARRVKSFVKTVASLLVIRTVHFGPGYRNLKWVKIRDITLP